MNVAQLLERSARYHADRSALIFGERHWTYAELDRDVSALAAGFAGLDLRRGDRVALHLPNRPDFVLAYYAALKAGLVPLSLNTSYKAEELEYIITNAAAAVVITADGIDANLPSRARMPSVRHLLHAKDLHGLRGQAALRAVETDRDDTAAILYTSATTGRPKGVMLSHANIVSNAYATVHHLRMTEDDRGLCALPMFHCFGQNAIMNSLVTAGGTLVLHERFVPDAFVAAVAAHGITILYAVPTMYILFLSMPGADFRSVRLCFSAAATLPTDVEARWHAAHGHWIQQGYGLTETSPFASYNHEVAFRPGSVGTPIENVEMKIVDAADGEVADGELGEIVIKGPNVMKGYFGDAAATAASIRGGWFHSGDIGYRDGDGYFFIVDRLKDMINVSGFKVFPREVEEVLFRHPAVKEAAVVGIPDPVRGEAVKAFVVLHEGASVSAEALQTLCRAAIAGLKVPERIEFIAALPKNPTGKILKKELRTRLE
jgi:long-chain acyl-CoA synthetase